jgi:gas vesicle protein GvpL/GvpF
MSTSPVAGLPTLSYVYAVARPGPELDTALQDGTGMAGGALRAVRAAGLAAVVCDVPEGEFDEAGLRAQLEDLERLEHLARAHHDVVEALAARETVLPLRLATVYRDDDRVAAMLEASREAFDARLDLLADTVEWGVKVYLVRGTENEPAQPAEAGTSPGRDFLRRRRAQRDSRQRAYRLAGEAAGRVREAASPYARAHVAHRPQEGRLATDAGEGENLVNDAYLVRREFGEEFTAAVAAAAREEEAVHVTVTGPWAPYSFAAPEAETREHADA